MSTGIIARQRPPMTTMDRQKTVTAWGFLSDARIKPFIGRRASVGNAGGSQDAARAPARWGRGRRRRPGADRIEAGAAQQRSRVEPGTGEEREVGRATLGAGLRSARTGRGPRGRAIGSPRPEARPARASATMALAGDGTRLRPRAWGSWWPDVKSVGGPGRDSQAAIRG